MTKNSLYLLINISKCKIKCGGVLRSATHASPTIAILQSVFYKNKKFCIFHNHD